jgi:RimJ/RimL family protein N-acetyltransferase
MAEPRIRRATEDDAADISAVIAEILKDPQPVALREPLTPEQVTRWLDRLGEHGGLFVCEVDHTVVGFAALDFNTEEPDTATLGVWLLADHRKKGYGTMLAERALEHARDQGYKRIRGRLPQNNEVALSFLSSIGALVPLYNPEARFELPL